MKRKKKVLITGADGRVGRGAAEQLMRDYDLVLTDIRKGEVCGQPIQIVDLLDWQQVHHIMKGVDAVVHLAIASFRHNTDMTEDEYDDEVMRVNVMGTQHLYSAAERAGVKRFVYMSSLTVMLGGKGLERRKGLSTDMPTAPRDLYACSKLFGEHLGETYAKSTDMAVICLRLGQPWPVKRGRHEKYNLRLADPSHRAVMVGYDDIAQMVRCAIEATDVKFKIVNLVSESSHRDVDLSGAAELGYEPKQYIIGQPIVCYDERRQ